MQTMKELSFVVSTICAALRLCIITRGKSYSHGASGEETSPFLLGLD